MPCVGGEHTRSVTLATPGARAGGIMGFVKKTITCLGCKTPLPDGATTLCSHCMQIEDQVYLRLLNNVTEKERKFSRLWTECQRCQGSLHQDVLCESRDCPIFYMRKKVQKDLKDCQGFACLPPSPSHCVHTQKLCLDSTGNSVCNRETDSRRK